MGNLLGGNAAPPQSAPAIVNLTTGTQSWAVVMPPNSVASDVRLAARVQHKTLREQSWMFDVTDGDGVSEQLPEDYFETAAVIIQFENAQDRPATPDSMAAVELNETDP